MSEYVLEKIALTLPQDILVNMQIGGFKQKNQKYLKKLWNYIIKENIQICLIY